jgi:hypothetical protein
MRKILLNVFKVLDLIYDSIPVAGESHEF